MKFKQIIRENSNEIRIDTKRTYINIIQILRYVDGVYQRKIKQIYAYKLIIPLSYTYYKDIPIYVQVASKKDKTYYFYFSEIGYKIFNDSMTLEEFKEKFQLSKNTIFDFIEDYRKDNKESGIYGNVRDLEPGIYPKKREELDDDESYF